MILLSVNAGSSSVKVALFEDERCLARGAVEGIGLSTGRSWLEPGGKLERRFDTHVDALEALWAGLERESLPHPEAVAHRLVHGGPAHHLPERVTPAFLESVRSVVAFAPLHLPTELACIEAVQARRPWMPQVVCFDTAFHWRMPDVARRFALPNATYERGVRRYGFHGLSYEYVVSALALPPRTVVAHLGSGASMVALKNGRSMDTTMGLTPTGGFMMSTRSGDLDPGVLLFLLRSAMDVEALAKLLERQSGLLGVSGFTSDMRTLLEARSRDPRAALAVEMFCYQCRKSVGALAAALGGLDALVFTGGMGENASAVRAEICEGLSHLGVEIDHRRNAESASVISPDSARCIVRVIATDEDAVIARHARAVLTGASDHDRALEL